MLIVLFQGIKRNSPFLLNRNSNVTAGEQPTIYFLLTTKFIKLFFFLVLQKHVPCQESSSLTVCADENPVARGTAPRVVEGIDCSHNCVYACMLSR